MAKVNCYNCDAEFNKNPSKITEYNFCSWNCFKTGRTQITKPCEGCGKSVKRCRSQMLNHIFCSRACSKKYLSEKMTDMNVELNPDRMVLSTRTKLREARLNTGEGKSYEKTFGRHTHRIVAENKLGRALKKGEVVHHEDERIRNNDPENLKVFKSQAEHARHHKNKQYKK